MRRAVVALVLLTVLVGAGTACSGGGGCSKANATDLTGDNPFTITMSGFNYQPSCFEAKSTSTIRFVNKDPRGHTFTISDTPVDVLIEAGKTVKQPGVNVPPGAYEFHCTIHPGMKGTVIVVGG
jgi:plastocyanin